MYFFVWETQHVCLEHSRDATCRVSFNSQRFDLSSLVRDRGSNWVALNGLHDHDSAGDGVYYINICADLLDESRTENCPPGSSACFVGRWTVCQDAIDLEVTTQYSRYANIDRNDWNFVKGLLREHMESAVSWFIVLKFVDILGINNLLYSHKEDSWMGLVIGWGLLLARKGGEQAAHKPDSACGKVSWGP